MKGQDYKTALVKHLIEMQHQAVSNARQAMEDAQEEANEYGNPKDQYDGFRNQQIQRKDMFARQLSKAISNLDVLNRIDLEKKHDVVGYGALVITDKAIFFVAIGIGITKFKDEDVDEDVAVISMLVPLFHAMKEKRVGDVFSFNKQEYKILDII
ncbi:MAG: hypothetical protein K8F24_05580 [Bacteroidales bacterium]|nr:hypothetical protein [Bacteroidales bacterium]